MPKILNIPAIDALLNEGTRPFQTHVGLIHLAFGAMHRYGDRTLTVKQWRALLRGLRFKQPKIEPLALLLAACYPQPLDFDQWHELFMHLAIINHIGQ